VFKNAVAKRGVPKKLFVDNGKIYHSHQMQLICASLGTILCYARPFSPESKGKIERWFGSLHEQWMNNIDWNDFSSLADLNDSLQHYVEDKYNRQLHSAIEQKPIDKFTKDLDRIKFIPNKKELDDIFLYRVTRKVKKDATISLNTIIFEVPQKYIGDKINVRYDPTSLEKAYIFSNEKKQETIYPVNKHDNTKIKRKQNVKPVDFSSFANNN
jgi:hypothetical protein